MKFFQPVLLTFMLGMSKSATAADYASTSAGSTTSTAAVASAPAAPSAASVVSNTPAISSTTNLATSASTNYESSSAWNPLAGVPPLPPSVPATQYSDAGTVTVLQGPLDGGYAAGPAAISVQATSTSYGDGSDGDFEVVSGNDGYSGQNGGNGGAFISSSISTSGGSGYGGSGYGGSQGGGSFGRIAGGYGGQSVAFGGNGASGSGGYGGQGGIGIGANGGSAGGYGGQSSGGFGGKASGGFQQIGGGAGDYNQDNGDGDNGDDGDDFGDDEGVAIGDGNGGGAGGDYGADIGAQGGDYAAKPVLIAKVTGGKGGGYGGGNGCGSGGCGGAAPLPVVQPIAKAPVQVAAPIDIPIKAAAPVFKPVPIYPVRTAYRHSTPYVSGTLSKYPVGTGFHTGRVIPFSAKKSVYYGPFRFNRPRIHAKPVQMPSLDLSALLGGLGGLSGLTSGAGLSLDKLAPFMPLFEAFAKNLPVPAVQMGDNGAAIQALLQTLAQIPLPSVSVNIPTNGPSAATLLSQLLSVGEKLSPTIKLDGAALSSLGNLAGSIAGLSGGLNVGGLGHGGLSLPAIKIDTSSHGQGLNLGSLAPLALPSLSLPSVSLGHSGGLSLSGLANIASSGLSGLSSGSGIGVGHGISLKPIPVPQVAPLTGPSVSLIKSLPILGKLKLPEIPSIPTIMQALSFHTITDMLGGLPRLSLTKKETPKVTLPIPVPVPKRIVSSFPMQRGPLKGHVVVEDFPYGRQQYGVFDEPCNDRLKGIPIAVGKGGPGY